MTLGAPKRFVVAGAGLSGAVIARELADAGFAVEVHDQRSHIAGNCHTARDADSGVLVHVYGPHIFHTDDEPVWDYLRRFTVMRPYINKVKAISAGRVYSLPINLHTINQFFGKVLAPREAQAFISSKADPHIVEPATFEEQALKFVGRELYEAFLKGYTIKQWGVSPRELPASILKRLPVRFDYDDNYFAHRFQGMPENGYTAAIEKMLSHPRISVRLESRIGPGTTEDGSHVFWSGALDAWFEHRSGRLGYRTLDFETLRDVGSFQGNAVINYCDVDVPYTRISEHKYFSPWEKHERTIIYREYSRTCGEADIPYYPIHLAGDKVLLGEYRRLAEDSRGVTFVGRLGTYRYLDMDVTIREALHVASRVLEALDHGERLKPFYATFA